MRAVITIRELVQGGKAGTLKFKDTSSKTWNCNKEELIPNLTAGERYFIDYNESQFQGSNGPVTMRWVNNARFWKDGDGANTWEDKEPYRGGGSGGHSGGGNVSKDNYDPEIGKRQTAANCAAQFLARQEGMSVDEFVIVFPVVADSVLKFVNDKGNLATVSLSGSEPLATGDSDEEFGF
jgi:hypothetical protein